MRTTFQKIWKIVLIMGAATLLTSCALQPGTVTLENYEKLKLGMTYEAVTDILGQPQDSRPFMGVKQHTWVGGERHIHAKFIFGRAVYYSSKGLEQDQPLQAHRPPG